MDATIAILTFNGEEYLDELLKQIADQKTGLKYETLVIDSGSTDKTLDIIAKHPGVRLHQIPNSDFGHGKTRNLAADMAKGDYVLFLTQDAVPSHELWLEAMVEPFYLSDKVAAVVGKQIPHPGSPATIKREVTSVFRGLGPDDSISLSRKNKTTEQHNLFNTFMSNTNSAVRKSIFKEIPFREVDYAEDQGLAIDVMDAGYYKAYSPLGAVNHSHDYGVREYFHRKFDEYVGLRKTTGYKATAGYRELVFGTLKSSLRDWLFILRDRQYGLRLKIKNIFTSPFYNLGLRLAIRAAANQKLASNKNLSLEAKLRQTKE